MVENNFTPTELYFVDQLHKKFVKFDHVHTINVSSEIGIYTDGRLNINIEAKAVDHFDIKDFYTENRQEISDEEFLNALMDCEEGGAGNG